MQLHEQTGMAFKLGVHFVHFIWKQCSSVKVKMFLIWWCFLGSWVQVHKESHWRSVKHKAYAYCGGEWSGWNTGSQHPTTTIR